MTDNRDNSLITTTKSRYHVTKIEEKVHLRRKYLIKWAVDPGSGRKYTVGEMIDESLIDDETKLFVVPSTREVVGMGEAIRSGLVCADLIDDEELVETSNESFVEYVEENNSITWRKVRESSIYSFAFVCCCCLIYLMGHFIYKYYLIQLYYCFICFWD